MVLWLLFGIFVVYASIHDKKIAKPKLIEIPLVILFTILWPLLLFYIYENDDF
jgi:hypothetical protein